MANNSTNVASYLILNSLSTGSKYGLEIIENISQRTGGHYIMKKPTLYSALTRMEKKGLISSSYWDTSDMGGKRHYYTITAAGQKELSMLEIEFQNSTFEDFDEDSTKNETKAEEKQADVQVSNDFQDQEPSRSVVGWQDSLFNMTETKKEEKVEEPKPSSDAIENQIDIFSFQSQQTQAAQEQEKNISTPSNNNEQQKMEYYQSILEKETNRIEADEPKQSDDGVLLAENDRLTVAQEQQNQRLYDNSSDLNRYRKRKSFAENQIEMSVDYETEEDREIQKERIENLKNSLLNFKQNKNEQILQQEVRPEPEQTAARSVQEPTFAQEAFFAPNEEPPRLDDAVFITSRYSENEIPVQKKITPPNIDIDVNDDNLPAPKRDTNLEPTYKDMMAKLFERKKEKEKLREENLQSAKTQQVSQNSTPQNARPAQTQQSAQPSYQSGNYSDLDSFADYDSLQRYYAERGIGFKEYRKTSISRNHNTNFLQFISSVVLLLLSGVGCAVIFGIVAGTKFLNPSTNFLFYTIPCIFLLYVGFTFAKHKLYVSKKASFTYNGVINWAVFILSFVVVLVVNIICGMQYEIFGRFLTSILVPTYAMFLAFPCNYYIKKFLYKHYAK